MTIVVYKHAVVDVVVNLIVWAIALENKAIIERTTKKISAEVAIIRGVTT